MSAKYFTSTYFKNVKCQKYYFDERTVWKLFYFKLPKQSKGNNDIHRIDAY